MIFLELTNLKIEKKKVVKDFKKIMIFFSKRTILLNYVDLLETGLIEYA